VGMQLLWYGAYGSNMASARLMCYLAGGCPPGARRTYLGARDPSPPVDVRPIELDGCVYFAWESPTWGGGIAFYDPVAEGTSVGRAYLMTLAQLSDVVAQEMRREPGVDLDLTELLTDGTSVLGAGRYDSLHVVGELDDVPVVTFTAPWRAHLAAHNAPRAAYLRTMAQGLVESQGWGADEVVDYLLARPGIGPGWDRDRLTRLAAGLDVVADGS
jgi:hypothetical protein